MAGHTFLFREGLWRVAGERRDGAGAPLAVQGEMRVRHEPGRWLSESTLRAGSNPPQEHRNRTEVAPFSPGSQSTHWSAESQNLGTLTGRLVVTGDAILSFYSSATGRYRGYECMLQKDAKRYSVRGAMLEQDKLISTWAFELEAA